MATSDPLVDSKCELIELESSGDFFKIWVKRYKSGRTRVLLPAGYQVTGLDNGRELTIELLPAQPARRGRR